MNKKSIYISLVLIVALTFYIVYLYNNDSPVSRLKPNSNFAIQNPEKIDRIVIEDITNETADLTFVDGVWMINDKYKARPENINLILNTVKDIEIQRNVPKASVQPVIKDIAAMHKKVTFYVDGEIIKTYFIGNPTQDHYGTFMLLQTPAEGKSSVPYIMHVPGFNGFLSTRFFGDENLWKYTGVFNYKIENIQKITVQHFPNTDESFIIKNKENNFKLFDINESPLEEKESLVKNYVLHYKKIHYNMIMDYTASQVDSVKALNPHYTISIEDINGKTNSLNIWKMAAAKNDLDPVTGKQREWDVNHALACLNNNDEILKFQYFTIDKLLVEKSFLKK